MADSYIWTLVSYRRHLDTILWTGHWFPSERKDSNDVCPNKLGQFLPVGGAVYRRQQLLATISSVSRVASCPTSDWSSEGPGMLLFGIDL